MDLTLIVNQHSQSPIKLADQQPRAPLAPADSNVRIPRVELLHPEGKAIIFGINRAGKRKAEEDPKDVNDIDSEDERLQDITMTCNQVRSKLNALISSNEMKIGELSSALGVSAKSFRGFMAQSGTMKGENYDAYPAGFAFLKKRELMGKAIPKKKVKKEEKEVLEKKQDEIKHIQLEDERDGKVPIYDSCDEIRKKINAYLKEPSMTQAGFLRGMAQTHPEGKKFQSKSLNDFMGKRGATAGNTSGIFYSAYIFFEKMRIKDDKPKSKHRLEMERIHGSEGLDIERGSHRGYLCAGNERPHLDQFGRVSFY